MTDVGTAVIGYGLGGRTFHVPLISAVPGLDLAAVVTSQVDRVHAEWPGIEVRGDVESVLTDPTIQLVVVSTPNNSHFDLATRALAAGKHVVVDKPFTVTVAEAEGIVAAAAAAGRVLSVFHNRRWDADFLTVQRLLASGRLGDLLVVESHYDRYRPIVRDRWRERDGPGAGTWYDLGAHVLDQVLVLWGLPGSITADLMPQRAGATATDYFHVVLRYPGGRRAILHGGSVVADADLRLAVHGTLGSYVKTGIDTQEAALKERIAPTDGRFGIDPREGRLTIARDDGAFAVEHIPNERGCYVRFYEGMRDAILTGAPPPVAPADAVNVMRVLDAAVGSANAGATVTVEPG